MCVAFRMLIFYSALNLQEQIKDIIIITRHSPTVDSFRLTLALQLKSTSHQLCSPMHIQEKTHLSRSEQVERASGVEMVAEHAL